MGKWLYADTMQPVSKNKTRSCGHCKLYNNRDDVDPCLGVLPGVSNACCGHGEPNKAYIQFKNGVTVRGFTLDSN